MFLYLKILVLLLLQTALSSPVTTPARGFPTYDGKHTQSHPSPDSNATTLTLGEPCGVYTQRCALGLRCATPEEELRPLCALLEGRGVCSNASSVNLTKQVYIATAPTDDSDEAPCRKLLTTIIKSLDGLLFKSHHDIYIPNCDKRGFFKQKQCWSSRGMQRGKCWQVNENGMPISLNTTKKSSLSC